MKTNFTLVLLFATLFSFAQQRTTINQAISVGADGVACVGGFVNKDNAATPSATDYSRLVMTVGVGCTQWLRGELDGAATPGDYAGFRIRTSSVTDLLTSVTVATYNGATRVEAKSGSNLLQLLSVGEGYIYFKTTLPHNAVQLEIGGTVTALFTTDVYVGFSQATTPGTVLPLQFGALNVKRQGTINNLSWNLSGNESLGSLQIERSADGRSFQPIANLAIDASSHNYQFSDAAATTQQYYRVKASTIYGKVYTSDIVSVAVVSGASVMLQNPVKGEVVMQTNSTKPVTIFVHNSAGQAVTQTIRSGGGQYNISLPSAKAGLYLVSIYEGKTLLHQSRILNM